MAKSISSLELHFVDGDPDGTLVAINRNLTGRVVRASEDGIRDVLKDEGERLGRAGVYLLLGVSNGKPKVYIGEGSPIGQRLNNRVSAKGQAKESEPGKGNKWTGWTDIAWVTAEGDRLNKAHVQYLEFRLCQIAIDAGNKSLLMNKQLVKGKNPKRNPPPLSKPEKADLEEFLKQILVLFSVAVWPILGVDIFDRREWRSWKPDENVQAGHEDEAFVMDLPKYGLHASAVKVDDDFVVKKGSVALGEWGGGDYAPHAKELREELKSKGVLESKDGKLRFKRDYPFRTTSLAATVIAGRNTNGHASWFVMKDGVKKTYGQWKKEQSENEESIQE